MTRPYDDEEDDFRDFSPSPREVPAVPKSPAQARGDYAGFDTTRDSKKIVNIHATAQLQVVLAKPERFEGASEVADHLRERRTVVLNLEQTNKEVARRLLDFLSGVAYAQDGKIKKVAVNTYLITPYNVDLLGDLIDELENNGLYF
jgi:cell division inhibitor SepF